MIKKINPFIIIGILCFILTLLVISVYMVKNEIKSANANLASYETKAKDISKMKREWERKDTFSRLKSFVSVQKNDISVKQMGRKIVLRAKGVDASMADSVIKNLLNEHFEIKSLRIQRADDKSVSMQVEVAK